MGAKTKFTDSFSWTILLSILCSIAWGNIGFTLGNTASISGTVRDSIGNPITGISISIDVFTGDICRQSQWIAGTNSNSSNGDYTISGIPPGTYYMRTMNSGANYTNEWWSGTGSTSDCGGAQTITLFAGDTLAGRDFRLDVGGIISGKVTRMDGATGIGNVHVYAEDFHTGHWLSSYNTAEDGSYAIAGLPSGDYRVRACASCSGLPYADESYNDVYSHNEAQSVNVIAGQTIPGVNFSLVDLVSISGRITDVIGEPIEGALVQVFSGRCWEGNLSGTTTDNSGNYTLWVPPLGEVYIHTCPGCVGMNYASEWWNVEDGAFDCDHAAPVAVIAGQNISGMNYSLIEAISISGRITDTFGEPIAGTNVTAFSGRCSQGHLYGTITDNSGNYTLWVPPVGEVYIETCPVCMGINNVGEWWNAANGTTDCNAAIRVPADPAQNQTGIDFSLHLGGTISGRVTETDGLTGIGNLHVYVEDFETNQWMGSTNTNPDGSYAIFGLPTGTYRVRTNASLNRLNYLDECYDNTHNPLNAAEVVVSEGQTTENINFSLEPGATIVGRVTEMDGTTGIGNLPVYVDDYQTGQWMGGTNTAPDGSYSIIGLPTGAYLVRACASYNGLPYVDEWYHDIYYWHPGLAQPIDVVAGQIQEINFSLFEGVSISGKVTDALDRPIVGMHVRAFSSKCRSQDQLGGANTDDTGNYTMLVPPVGEVFLDVCTGCSNLNYINEWWNAADGTTNCNAAISIPAIEGQSQTGINFALDIGYTISGKVTQMDGITGVANVFVYVEDYQTGQWRGDNRTALDGTYTISGLPPGDYRVRACASCSGLPYADESFDDAYGQHDAQPVSVIAGQQTSGIDFSLIAGITVSGRVTDSQNQSVAGMHVHAYAGKCWQKWLGGADTDGNGNYAFVIPAIGEAYIRTCDECKDMLLISEWWDAAAGTVDCNAAVAVPATEGQDQNGINFSLDLGGSIAGTIKDNSGNPITGLQINVTVFTGNPCDQNQGIVGAKSNPSDGTYTVFGIPPGTYSLETWNNGTDYVNEWWSSSASTFDCNGAQTITILAGETLAGKDFQLDLGGTISGKVNQMDGATGIDNLHVYATAYFSNQWLGGTNTGPDGSYSIAGLPMGSYRVRACATCSGHSYGDEFFDNTPDYNAARAVVVLSGQTTPDINFALFVDSDHDNLADDWETSNFGNLSQSGSGDPDGDGLSNQREAELGTNPVNADTDGDKMTDGYEVNSGTSPTNPLAAPGLPVTGYVTSVRHFDDTFYTLIELVIGSGFVGVLPDEISSITINGPNGLELTIDDLDYLPQFRDFYVELPGTAALGEYVFTAASGTLTGTDRDYQNNARTLPIPDKTTFSPQEDEIVSTKTPFFSWELVEFPDFPLCHRLEIADMNGNRVFSTDHRLGMTFCTLPPGLLNPGQTYRWRIRVVDHSNAKLIENRANSEWLTFTMADTLDHAAPPALDLTWGASSWTNSGATGVSIDAAVIDHDGVARDGSSHQVKVKTPDGAEYPLRFGSSVNATQAYFSYWSNSAAPGDYTFTVTDPDGNTTTAVDALTVNPLSAPDESSFTPSLKNPVTETITAFFDNVYVDGAPYEDFDTYGSIDELSAGKWMQPSGASIENQKLKITIDNTIGRGRAGVNFTNAYAIRSTRADVTIDSASSDKCYARIYWESYYNGVFYCFTDIRVEQNEVRYRVAKDYHYYYNTMTFPEPLASGKLLDVNSGQTATLSISWDEATKTLTFAATNGIDSNTAAYTFTEGPYPDFNAGKALLAGIDLKADTTSTFTWDPVPGANWYRVRIYNWNKSQTIWTGYANETSYTVPPGVMKPDGMYHYNITAFDSHRGFPVDNASYNGNSYIFYTESTEDPNPFIDLNNHGVKTWNDDVNGPVLSFWLIVHDAQGVPEDISTVTVTLPGGSTFPLIYDADDSVNANTKTSGGYYLDLHDELPVAGTYTFTVTDLEGNQYSAEEELTPNPIGYPNLSSLTAAVHGTGVDFDWEDVPDVVPGQGFYRLEIYNRELKRIYTFPTTESQYHLPEGFLKEGETYRWRITTRREFLEQNVDNASRSPASFDDMPFFHLGAIKGDVNGDGAVDLNDAVLALKVIAGLSVGGLNPAADVDEDGRIGLAEVAYILQALAVGR